MKTSFIFLYLLIVTKIALCQSSSFFGKVVAVADGDTFTLLDEKKVQHKIRLFGIDCPEKKQDFGTKARQFTSEKCFGKTVNIIVRGKDRYDRTIGEVILPLPDSGSLNKMLLKAGLAWHYKHFDKSNELAFLESEARKKKIGIWSQPNPTAPWEFRRAKRNKTPQTY